MFLRDILPTKTKFNECGILNVDSSSDDGTHWVMWFKKGKDKFYFDSYGVQPPSVLIAYLVPPIFYNSERVQQNGFLRRDGVNTTIETIDMNSNIIKIVSDPVSNQDVATKNYVDTNAFTTTGDTVPGVIYNKC